MKKYIGKTALFLLLFCLPLLVLEVALRQPEADSYSLKKYLLDKTVETNEVLILGTSLAWTGLNPARIGEHCINLANYSQAFYYDLLILKSALPKAKNLNVVVLPLSSLPFFGLPSERAEKLYSVYWGLPPFSGKKDLENYSAVLAYGLREALRTAFEPQENLEDRGWGAFNIVYDGNESSARMRLKNLHEQMAFEHFETCTAHLDSIVNLCKQHGIRLVLFHPPYSPTLNKLLEGNPYEEKMREYLRTFCPENDLEFYDFNDNGAFTATMFRDADHVNAEGSELLSRLIRDVIAGPPNAGDCGELTGTRGGMRDEG